jgi:hypothetical protein
MDFKVKVVTDSVYFTEPVKAKPKPKQKCKMCGDSYINLKLHHTKAHESIFIFVKGKGKHTKVSIRTTFDNTVYVPDEMYKCEINEDDNYVFKVNDNDYIITLDKDDNLKGIKKKHNHMCDDEHVYYRNIAHRRCTVVRMKSDDDFKVDSKGDRVYAHEDKSILIL